MSFVITQNSINVHNTIDDIATTPIYATILVASTRWVKFLKYHVRTPHIDITIHKPYHKGGKSLIFSLPKLI